MKLGRQFLTFLILIVSSYSLFAGDISVKVEQTKQTGLFSLAVGSEVSLMSINPLMNPSLTGAAVFIGEAKHPDGQSAYELYLNKQDQKIYYIKTADIDQTLSVGLNKQSVVNPDPQVGGTCTAYAINYFLHQTNLSGFQGTGELNQKISSEKGRSSLLVSAVNEYYLTPRHRYSIAGILNKYGKTFGFNCKKTIADSYDQLREKILSQLKTGSPVMVSFNIGPNMYHSPFALEMLNGQSPTMDDRLWIPRKIGERKFGGHTVVAAASFEFNNKTYLVMIDSDWSEPRIWDMDLFLNSKTALSEIEIMTCR